MAKNKYTWNDLLQFINSPKSSEIEFKSSIADSKDLAQLFVSFANSTGGTLVLGFNKTNVQLTGFEHDKEWILSASKRDCSPSLSINVSEIPRGDKKIFIIEIPEGNDKPYKVNNISYVRGDEKQQIVEATPEMEKEMNPFGVNGLNARQREALGYIQRNGKITNKDFRELNQVSHKTAHIELTELVTKGVLQTSGAGRSTCYVIFDGSQPIAQVSEEKPAAKAKKAQKVEKIEEEKSENTEEVPQFLLAQETFEFKAAETSPTSEVIEGLTTTKIESPYESTELEPFELEFDDSKQEKEEAVSFPQE